MIGFQIARTEASLAEPLVAETEQRLAEGSWPVWISDGLDAYGKALKKRHCIVETYPRTGKRGRPRRGKLVACPELRYAQVVKERDERHRLIGVTRRSVYGDVPLNRISTIGIERHNLNVRHENRRLARKTIAFSKKVRGLVEQMLLFHAYFNVVRLYRGLRICASPDGRGGRKWQRRTPVFAAGLTKHNWTLDELMSHKIFINY